MPWHVNNFYAIRNHDNTYLSVSYHAEDITSQTSFTSQGFELSREARAQADIKFTYVVSCQIYGQQKQRKAPEAADIALLLQRCAFVILFLSNIASAYGPVHYLTF